MPAGCTLLPGQRSARRTSPPVALQLADEGSSSSTREIATSVGGTRPGSARLAERPRHHRCRMCMMNHTNASLVRYEFSGSPFTKDPDAPPVRQERGSRPSSSSTSSGRTAPGSPPSAGLVSHNTNTNVTSCFEALVVRKGHGRERPRRTESAQRLADSRSSSERIRFSGRPAEDRRALTGLRRSRRHRSGERRQRMLVVRDDVPSNPPVRMGSAAATASSCRGICVETIAWIARAIQADGSSTRFVQARRSAAPASDRTAASDPA
jgi:hypothetical protein